MVNIAPTAGARILVAAHAAAAAADTERLLPARICLAYYQSNLRI